MTELQIPASDPEKSVGTSQPATAAEHFHADTQAEPVLISEPEVLLGTAAALQRLAGPPPPTRKKHYARPWASYYETSLMSRERYRL